jgi:hypothetical protein
VSGLVALSALFSAALLIGSLLSEIFMLSAKEVSKKVKQGAGADTLVSRSPTLQELLAKDCDARDAYAFMRTCGLDLSWYAARIRLLGAGGLGLAVASISSIAWGPLAPKLGAIALAVLCIAIAFKRMRTYENYAATVAYLGLCESNAGVKLTASPSNSTDSPQIIEQAKGVSG